MRRCSSSENTGTGSGSAGAPTFTNAPSVLTRLSILPMSMTALTVLMIRSKRWASSVKVASSLVA